jgi:HTH-type transcriptional regulator/antitoxin HigA
VPTGRIIKEYLDECGISQKDLAQCIAVSENHIPNMPNGKTRLMEDMTLRLEHVMSDIRCRVLVELRGEMPRIPGKGRGMAQDRELDLEDIARSFHFFEILEGMDMALAEEAGEIPDLLGVASFDCWDDAVLQAAAYLEAPEDAEAAVVWLRLCEDEADDQWDEMEASFNRRKLTAALEAMKKMPSDLGLDDATAQCRELLNAAGACLVAAEPAGECRIEAALFPDDEYPTIYVRAALHTGAKAKDTIAHEAERLGSRPMPKKIHMIFEGVLCSEAVAATASAPEAARNMRAKVFAG